MNTAGAIAAYGDRLTGMTAWQTVMFAALGALTILGDPIRAVLGL